MLVWYYIQIGASTSKTGVFQAKSIIKQISADVNMIIA